MTMFQLGGPLISDVDENGRPIVFKAPKASVFGGATDTTTVPGAATTGPATAYTAAPRISLGGFTPDYKSLIEQDPGLMAVRSGNVKNIEDAASARKAALRALAVKYGGLPAGFTDRYGDLDQGTLDQAAKNQYSDEATLGRNYQQTIEGFRRGLAARGMLQSSELDYGQNQADLSRGQQEYDLGNSFGAAAQSAVNTFAGYESQARTAEAQAIADAASRQYSAPGNQPIPDSSAALVDNWQSQYGQPVYMGPDGKLYDEKGNIFSPGGGTTPAPSPIDTGGASGTTTDTPPVAPPTDTSAAPAPGPTLPSLYQAGTIVQPGSAYVDESTFAPPPAPAPIQASEPQMIYWRNPLTGQIEAHPAGWMPPAGTAGAA